MTTDNPTPQPAGEVGAPELSPCRFCGKESKIEEFFIDNDPQPWYVATCVVCPVKTYDQTTPQEAARIWNTRTQPATAQGDLADHVRRVLPYCSQYGDSVCICDDDQPVGVHDDECDDARRLWERVAATTPTDVAERARRAAEEFNELLNFSSSGYQRLSPDFAKALANIIAAEFGGAG